jgi:hypothetical protein
MTDIPALTIWEVCGYHRDDDRKRVMVYMLVEAPRPCPDGPESHFAIASRIAGEDYRFVTAWPIGTVPPGYELNVLLDHPPRLGQNRRKIR